MNASERKLLVRVIGLGLLATLLAVGVNIWYTNRTDRASERRTAAAIRQAEARQAEDIRRWCGLLRLLDDRNQELPPSPDPATMQFRREVHELRIGYGC